MKILITGGAGFIGSNVADAYVLAGHEVVVLDDLSSGRQENVNPRAKFIRADVRSLEARAAIVREAPDVINHHAAQISVPASVEDPIKDAQINVIGFLNVLEASRACKVKKIIFISSGGAIYGEAEEFPTTENYRPRPLSPYAVTKAVSEQYLAFYNHQYGLDYTVLRYANVYGPRQIAHGEAGVVAIFMDRLLEKKPCTLYHFPEEPRGMTRDYAFVEDVARANVLALEGGSGGAFNIGTGVATHTLDLFNAIFLAIADAKPDTPLSLKTPGRGLARPGDIKQSCLDAAKAKKILGWAPAIGLKEGIAKTLEWRVNK